MKGRKTAFPGWVFILPLLASILPAQGQRVALMIGNAAYVAGSPLKNTLNDARDMEASLKGAGFKTSLVLDGGLEAMAKALDAFAADIRGSEIALLYYSGHGVQSKGENYMMPVDAVIRAEGDLRYKALAVGEVLSAMEASGSGANILILDACRDNPFAKGWKSSARGLTVMDAPSGTIIVYATKPGGVSSDGEGRNGAWTGAFLRQAGQAGLELLQILKRTRVDVMAETGNEQVPWENSSLTGDIYLFPAAPGASDAVGQAGPAAVAAPEGMALIRGGRFRMGSPPGEAGREDDEGPQREVEISDFFMGTHEVSLGEYDAYCDALKLPKPDDGGWGRGLRPAVNVSWLDAAAYCNWRSGKEGLEPAYRISGTDVVCVWSAKGYRLPTEAEWEYACRAGTATPFSSGEALSSAQANFDGSRPYGAGAKGEYRGKTLPAGSFSPNPWGLYDMHGNVWEWVWDWYGGYAAAAGADPRGPASGAYRVRRGGSLINQAADLRSANRGGDGPETRTARIGFRLARNR